MQKPILYLGKVFKPTSYKWKSCWKFYPYSLIVPGISPGTIKSSLRTR